MRERRAHPREPRRIQLVFWDRNDPQDRRTGFTSDTSVEGAFISTHRPLRSGSRIQLELAPGPGHFLAEALVVRSITVPPDLRKIKPGGMGVRILSFAHFLSELDSEQDPEDAARPDAHPEPETEKAASPAPESPSEGPAKPARARRKTDFERSRGGTDPARLHPAAAPARRDPEPGAPEDHDAAHAPTPVLPAAFRVAFPSLDALRDAYERELQHGALFVPTETPSPVDSPVSISLDLPQGLGSIDVSARVVQVLPPGGAAVAGMGTLIDDDRGLAADLARILEQE